MCLKKFQGFDCHLEFSFYDDLLCHKKTQQAQTFDNISIKSGIKQVILLLN